MTILLALAAGYLLTAVGIAAALSRMARAMVPTPEPEPAPSWIPDTAHELLELTA